MFNGPGKYDELCTDARHKARADGAILIIFDGKQGNGFEVQASLPLLLKLPDILRSVAKQIEAQQRKSNVVPMGRKPRPS